MPSCQLVPKHVQAKSFQVFLSPAVFAANSRANIFQYRAGEKKLKKEQIKTVRWPRPRAPTSTPPPPSFPPPRPLPPPPFFFFFFFFKAED